MKKTKLSQAFSELRKRGYVAYQSTTTEKIQAKLLQGKNKGACYYRTEDMKDKLYISFSGQSNEQESFEVAATEILEVLATNGIVATWDGNNSLTTGDKGMKDLSYKRWLMSPQLESQRGRTYNLGYAAIYWKEPHPNLQEAYILDGMHDGWFRKDVLYGEGKGYGLMLRDIKITSKEPWEWADGHLYLVKFTYLSNNVDYDDGSRISSLGYLYVNEDVTIEDVLQYIKDNSANWVPCGNIR